MQVQTYLSFNGRCEEALAFYQQTLGAKLGMVMRFKDSPDPLPPGMNVPPEGVMHSELTIGETKLMASDGCNTASGFGGFSLSISAADEAEATRVFAALAAGGKIDMPLGKTFWSPCFGTLTDKFGVSWLVNVEPVPAAA